jgi:Tfp pilus assembly protein PilO
MIKGEKEKINKIITVSAMIIITALFIGVIFIYMPFLNRNKSLRANIVEERDRNVLIGKIRALGKHLKVYSQRLPEGRGVSWLLSEVSDMASKEQIEVLSIKPENPEDKGLYTKLYVVMDTISTYHQLGRFMSKLESSKKFLKVESINIKKLDLVEGFNKETSRFKSFDVKSHLVISTVVLKE